jgi:hypothetical protein
MRWWGYGPIAGRFASAVGSFLWFAIGVILVNVWAKLLPTNFLLYILCAGLVVVIVAGLRQVAKSGWDKA